MQDEDKVGSAPSTGEDNTPEIAPEVKREIPKEEIFPSDTSARIESVVDMADQENGAAAAAQEQEAAGEEIQVPKKNQKPSEPPVTFREFEVLARLSFMSCG